MAWLIKVASSDRSPVFRFIASEGARALEGADGRTIQTGYRFEPKAGSSPLRALQTDKKKLCDVFHILGYDCVSLKVKAIVEDFEPDTHQFFPIGLQDKNSTPYDAQYFIFNPTILLDAYLDVKDASWSTRSDGFPYIGGHKTPVSALEIAGHHIWVGEFMGRRGIHVSDELNRRLEKEKVRYLYRFPLDERDEPWRPEEQMPRAVNWLEADESRVRDFAERRPDWVRRHRPEWLET